MSLAQKNNWQPSATIDALRKRAQITRIIREFFEARNVLEVETPMLCHTSVTDPYIQSIPALLDLPAYASPYYLQTSPEYAMKRLLAAGSGSIFQITKAFRQAEVGRRHNPEFTMLEWYRIGFDHHQLMDEMDALLQLVLRTPPAERMSYAAVFQKHLEINPHACHLDDLKACAEKYALDIASTIEDNDTWLQLLFSHCIEPTLGRERPFFLYDFPVAQAALARIQAGNPPVASRFEVYYQGMELANGFHELSHADEQRHRFMLQLEKRRLLGLPILPIDEYFLSALSHGLPDCAGVALGLDRLVMLAVGASHIREVMSFDVGRC